MNNLLKLSKITLLFVLLSLGATAQNLQTHYDFDREHITTTLEMFKPDAYGNTFFFVDMNYDPKLVNSGVSLGYWEIARVLKTEKMPIGAHVEFNSGIGTWKAGEFAGYFNINNAFLAGVDYSWNAGDFSKGFAVKALYKYIHKKHNASFQFTGVWYWHFLDRKLTFMGFADFWKEDTFFSADGSRSGEYVFLTEPQIWYNLNDHFSFGGELELSNNFDVAEFKARPTVAVKWTF